MEKFVMVDGYVSMDNSKLYVDINSLKRDVKNRGGWLGIFFVLIGYSIFKNLSNEQYFEKISHYINFGLQILGMIVIIAVLWYVIFKRKSKRNLIINDITLIEIDKGEFETELTIKFSNKREIELNFRTLENQIQPFIESLKKRNTRITIKDESF